MGSNAVRMEIRRSRGSDVTRRLVRRGLRGFLRSTRSSRVRSLAGRVPTSRFKPFASWLLWGNEVVAWRGLQVEVNPGRHTEYYLYLLEEYATEAIKRLIE